MPKTTTVDKHLRPYAFHGVEMGGDGEQLDGDCPFCGREGKFRVSRETGLWQCKVCQAGSDAGGGNAVTFLRLLWQQSFDATTSADHEEMRLDRGLLEQDALIAWGAAKSALTGLWLMPAHSPDGKLTQLYVRIRTAERWEMRPTPGDLGHACHGVPLLKGRGEVWVAEGPWDGMALWEAFRGAKEVGGELVPTASEGSSLLASRSVLAVPNCGAVGEPLKRYLPLLAGKRVVLAFDSDHPREQNGKMLDGAGLAATQRMCKLLAEAKPPPESVSWIKWGADGWDQSLKSGFDVRDALTAAKDQAGRCVILGMLERNAVVPCEHAPAPRAANEPRREDLETLPCKSWGELTNAWRKAMRWVDGLDQGLACSLAVCLSTESVGEDQLWLKLIGVPSSGKTTIMEGLSTARRWVLPKDTFSGLASGYQADKDGGENMSLAPKLKNKTLVINDGDTMMSLPNLPQIMSQLRAFYGRNLRTSYGNKMSADHEGISATIIISGTEDLQRLNTSELGERWLDCVVMDKMESETEDEIALRKARQVAREMSMRYDGKPETRGSPAMIEAKRLTGGYVERLRENAQESLGLVEFGEDALLRCAQLGTMVAFLRCRPSKRQGETVQRELSFRLVAQLTRLATCLAVVLNRREVDGEVMRRVRKVALDTARGTSCETCRHLWANRGKGLSLAALAILTGRAEAEQRDQLTFLRRVGAAECKKVGQGQVAQHRRWHLSPRLLELWSKVVVA